MKLTQSQTTKIKAIINNFKAIETGSFVPEITNQDIICNGVVIFTFKKKVVEEYKNSALSLMQKSWCITIGKNGRVRFVNEQGKLVDAKDLYFV
jgi:hypothetical protein